MVTIGAPRPLTRPTVPWRTLVTIVLAKAAWDVVSLLAGGVPYTGPAYDVLRSMPPVGGVRLRGVVLAVLTIAAFAAARWARCGRERPLRICLSLLSAWYMTWAAGLASAWIYHARVLSWGAAAAMLVVAVLAAVAAKATPKQVGGGQCGPPSPR